MRSKPVVRMAACRRPGYITNCYCSQLFEQHCVIYYPATLQGSLWLATSSALAALGHLPLMGKARLIRPLRRHLPLMGKARSNGRLRLGLLHSAPRPDGKGKARCGLPSHPPLRRPPSHSLRSFGSSARFRLATLGSAPSGEGKKQRISPA